MTQAWYIYLTHWSWYCLIDKCFLCLTDWSWHPGFNKNPLAQSPRIGDFIPTPPKLCLNFLGKENQPHNPTTGVMILMWEVREISMIYVILKYLFLMFVQKHFEQCMQSSIQILWKNTYHEWHCCHFRGLNVHVSTDSEMQELPDLSVPAFFFNFSFLRRPFSLLINFTFSKTWHYINIMHFIHQAVNNIA